MLTEQRQNALDYARNLKAGRFKMWSWRDVATMALGDDCTEADLDRFVHEAIGSSGSRPLWGN